MDNVNSSGVIVGECQARELLCKLIGFGLFPLDRGLDFSLVLFDRFDRVVTVCQPSHDHCDPLHIMQILVSLV